ncbi:MAG: hypothetical protein QW039_01440 [Fervidicoccaceae archaeon]
MPIVTIKFTDEEFNQLRTKAASKGFESISDYIKSIIFAEQKSLQPLQPQKEAISQESVQKEKEIAQSVARAVQDIVNPFTGKIDELARSIAELRERIDKLEETIQKQSEHPLPEIEERRTARTARGGTAIERLSIEGVVFQSELTWLKNPRAFFDKLRREGAIVLELEKEYVAVDPEFWDKFQAKMASVKEKDPAKVVKLLPEKMATLYKKLLSEGRISFDPNENAWRVSF